MISAFLAFSLISLTVGAFSFATEYLGTSS
jgi:hypothetical protein